MFLIKKIKNLLLMLTTSLFPALSFNLESKESSCDSFCKTDDVLGKNCGLIVCNTSGQDLVVQSIAFDKNDLFKGKFNVLPDQKMASLSTVSPSKNSKSFFNQFTFAGKNDAKDKLVVRIEVDSHRIKDRSFYTEGSLEVTSSYTKNDNNLVIHLNRVY
jgi:hypothetical protein